MRISNEQTNEMLFLKKSSILGPISLVLGQQRLLSLAF